MEEISSGATIQPQEHNAREVTMRAVALSATWAPRGDYRNDPRDVPGERTQCGSKVWQDPKVELVDLPVPEVHATGVLIRVQAAGICGSDVHIANPDAQRYMRYPFMARSGVVLGHEFSGIIEATGKDVPRLRPDLVAGMSVTVQCVENCGLCLSCSLGKFDECSRAEERGFTTNGAFSEYCVADCRHVWSLDSLAERLHGSVSDDAFYQIGSLIEPLTGTYKAIRDTGFTPGSNVLIVGAGPIGCAAQLVFQALGAGRVIVAEPVGDRRLMSEALGAYGTVDPARENLAEAVLTLTHGGGVEVIFEASGLAERNWDAITALLAYRSQTRLVFFGQSRTDVPLNPQLFIQHYAMIRGSHGHTGVWPEVISLVAAGRINPLPLITRTITLSELPEWLVRLDRDKSECKVMVTKFSEKGGL